jgi:UDP-glucose 4-epimerase
MSRTRKRVLVTGVAGFIGSQVARRFLQEGYQVVGVDDLSMGDIANVPGAVEFIQADLAEPATLQLLPRDCPVLLHLAGQSSGEISFDDPVADLHKNVVSTLQLIRHGMECRAERIVYASSMSVYGAVAEAAVDENCRCAPLSCYGVGKLAAEAYLQVYMKRLPAVALRMFNVYGPGQNMGNLRQGMVSIYLAQALAGGSIQVKGQLDRFRDFIYIEDVVEVWQRAAVVPAVLGRTLNVGTGIKTTVELLLQQICALVPGSSYFVSEGTPGDQRGIYADTANLRQCLQVERFTPLTEGLAKFADWARRSASVAKVSQR